MLIQVYCPALTLFPFKIGSTTVTLLQLHPQNTPTCVTTGKRWRPLRFVFFTCEEIFVFKQCRQYVLIKMLICCEQNMDFGRCSETSFQLDCEASFPLNLVHLVKLKSRCPLSSKEKKLKNFVTWCLWCIGNSSISISNLFLTNAAVCGKICTTYMYKPTMAGFKWSELSSGTLQIFLYRVLCWLLNSMKQYIFCVLQSWCFFMKIEVRFQETFLTVGLVLDWEKLFSENCFVSELPHVIEKKQKMGRSD